MIELSQSKSKKIVGAVTTLRQDTSTSGWWWWFLINSPKRIESSSNLQQLRRQNLGWPRKRYGYISVTYVCAQRINRSPTPSDHFITFAGYSCAWLWHRQYIDDFTCRCGQVKRTSDTHFVPRKVSILHRETYVKIPGVAICKSPCQTVR